MAKGRKAQICITPECGRKVKLRGVCLNCYQTLYQLIRSETKTADGQLITWQLLESQGRVLPPHDKGNSRRPAMRAIASLLSTEQPVQPPTQPTS